MSIYCTPTILKDKLENGRKISNIFYELNPLRDPNKRINYYRNVFSEKLDKVFPYFKIKKIKKNRQPKSAWKAKSALYNSYYSKLFNGINFYRPREIKNDDGVIISRHFRSLYINSREYPKTKFKSFSIRNRPSRVAINFNEINNKHKNNNGNFFRTEVKFDSNINKFKQSINIIKNGNQITSFEHNTGLSYVTYNSKTNSFFTNKSSRNKKRSKENSKNNMIISAKNINLNNKIQNKIPPLLFKSN